MYLVLLFMSSNMNPSDLMWSFAFVNVLAGVAAWKRPSARRFIALLAGLDSVSGLCFVIWAFRQDWALESVRAALSILTHGVSGIAGIGMALWVFSGNRAYEVVLPLRGGWASRFFAAIAIASMHFSSATYYTSQQLLQAIGSTPLQPTDLLPAALVANLTLPSYYFSLWKVTVEGRSGIRPRTSSDRSEPQSVVREN